MALVCKTSNRLRLLRLPTCSSVALRRSKSPRTHYTTAMAKSAAMAVVIAKRLHYAAITSFTCPYVSHSRPTSRLSVPQRRTFTSTLAIQRPTPQNETRVSPEHFRAQLSEDAQVEYDSLSPEERLEVQLEAEEEDVYINQDEQQSILRTAINEEAQEVEKSYPPPERPVMRFKPGFMAMGEEDEEGTGEDDDFEEDDISTPAHAELERHREMREYARITAWEMPLLSSTLSLPRCQCIW